MRVWQRSLLGCGTAFFLRSRLGCICRPSATRGGLCIALLYNHCYIRLGISLQVYVLVAFLLVLDWFRDLLVIRACGAGNLKKLQND